MAGYTLSASVERLGTYRDVKITSALAGNAKVGKEAYDAAVKTAASECTMRGARCRAAEEAVKRARESLSEKPVQGVADSMGARIIAVLPFLTPEQVQLYQPLTLPIGLQFGGFFLLALGISPRPRSTKPAEGGQTRRGKQNRKRGSQKRPAKKTLGTAANVVDRLPHLACRPVSGTRLSGILDPASATRRALEWGQAVKSAHGIFTRSAPAQTVADGNNRECRPRMRRKCS
jgi:hypothetical protein